MKKNRKLCSVIIFCSLVSSMVFGAEKGIGNKVSELNSEQYRFFSGFEFGEIPVEAHKNSLEKCVNSEIDYVIEDDIEKGNTGKYAIVGHSQGGIRVLAYATMLERRINDPSLSNEERAKAKANYDRLSAVVTMSGVDKGLKALEGNFTIFKAKLLEDANCWIDGVNGAKRVTLATTIAANVYMNKIGLKNPEDIIKILLEYFPEFTESYVLAGWNGAPYEEIPEIYDMVPNSNFVKKNISETTSVTYKVQTGTRTYKNWEQVAKFWWWWVEHSEPVYTTYTEYKDNPKFSNKIPVGYVVGTDSNTLGMLDKNTENEVRANCKKIADAFNACQIALHAECYGELGIGFLTGKYTGYKACCNARDWFNDIDGQLNDLKGSTENDGLVAKESQYIQKTFYNPKTGKSESCHTNVLGDIDNKGYRSVNYNHAAICCDEVFNRIVKQMLKEANQKN